MAGGTIPNFHKPNSRLLVKGRGVVAYDEVGKPYKVWTRYGDVAPNPWLNQPLPNATYVVGASAVQRKIGRTLRHRFVTRSDGTTDRVEVTRLERFRGKAKGATWRKEKVAPVGFPGGRFDRGHLIAAEFGAGMEAINLVSMPESANRPHKPDTARSRGFDALADLGDRYRKDHLAVKGSLTYRGEIILPNYRHFELAVRNMASDAAKRGLEVGLCIRPTTVEGVTDILHAELFLGDQLIRFVLDNDLDR